MTKILVGYKNNYRLYDEDALERIWQILLYKEMGFELKDIKQLLEISENRKNEYFVQRMEVIKSQFMKLKVQMGIISLVQEHGMPLAPAESGEATYKGSIAELKRKIV